MSIGKRLKEFRQTTGLSSDLFCQKCEISEGSLSKYENDLSLPSSKNLIKMRNTFDLDINFILTGERKNDLTPEEKEMIEIYQNLCPEQKERILAAAKFELKQKKAAELSNTEENKNVS